MSTFRRRLLLKLLMIFDIAVLVLGLCAALELPNWRHGPPMSTLLSLRVEVHDVLLVAILALAWHSLLSAGGLYHSKRIARRWIESLEIVKSVSCATVVLGLFALLSRNSRVTLSAIALFFLFASSILLLSRLALRTLLRAIRERGRNLRHILIAGTNSRAVSFADELEQRHDLGYRVIGYIDSDWGGVCRDCLRHPVVCDCDGLTIFLREHVVDELVLAFPLKSMYPKASMIVSLCREQGIVVRILPDMFGCLSQTTRTDDFDQLALVSLYTSPWDTGSGMVKRIIDILISAMLLASLAPLLLLIALLIKLDSPGPALFTQTRVGLNKRRFRMYKFRSMIANAEAFQTELESRNEVSGPVFKIAADPRVTKFGRFLRKTSMDELPQLLNVLKGEMSLVGPRPLPERDYEGFDQDWQRRRFSVRPGITCLWQVSGRSSIPFAEWMNFDMQYIDDWSLWLDIKILAKTIPAVLRGTGAA